MTNKTNNAKELLDLLYGNVDFILDDQINYFKKVSKSEEDDEHLSYLIWLREQIKSELNTKKLKKKPSMMSVESNSLTKH